jgi:hypothetical protein
LVVLRKLAGNLVSRISAKEQSDETSSNDTVEEDDNDF